MKTYKQVSSSQTEVCLTSGKLLVETQVTEPHLASYFFRILHATCPRVFGKSLGSTLNILPCCQTLLGVEVIVWEEKNQSQFQLLIRLRQISLKFSTL